MATVNVFGKTPNLVKIAQVSAFNEVLTATNTPQITGKFSYNINPELFKDESTASGSVSVSPPFSLTQSGAASNSSGVLSSIRALEYLPGSGGLLFFTAIFDTPVDGNTQYVGLGDPVNALMIGYNNTTFSVLRRDGGVDYIVNQDDFNEDTLDGNGPSGMTIDTTKGNVFRINYQWLGFGEINFSVENPESGTLFIFHRIKYANSAISTTLTQPTLPARIESINTTNATNISIKVPSIGAYVQTVPNSSSYLTHAASNKKAAISSEVALLTIYNKPTYSGVINYVRVDLKYISIACDGTKTTSFNFYKNATLGGSPSFINYNPQTSVIAIDKSGTTVSDGILIGSIQVAKSAHEFLDWTNSLLQLNPGDTLSVTATSSQNTDVSASITWGERF